MGINHVELSTGDILIDLRHDTATPETVLPGVMFHGANGEIYLGALKAASSTKDGLMSKEDKIKLDNSVFIDTTSNWNKLVTFVPQKGSIIIYSDFDENKYGASIPGIKIGDGKTYLSNLAFVSDDIREDLLNTITTILLNYTEINKTITDEAKKINLRIDNLPEIPTNVSDFVNDAGYLTEHQDLSEYAKTENIPTNLSQLNSDSTHRTVTDELIQNWLNKSDFDGSYNNLSDKPTIPTKTSDLTNDTGFITEDKNTTYTFQTTSTGFIVTPSDGQPQSLDVGSNITIDSELNSSSENPVQNKVIKAALDEKLILSDLPTSLSQLTNDTNFITSTVNNLTNYYLKSDTYTKAEVNQLVTEIPKFSILVVSTLPSSEISNTTIYLLKSGEETGNLYTEYIYVNSQWEKLGTQKVDLTGYALKSDIPTKVSELINDKGYLTEHQDITGKQDKLSDAQLANINADHSKYLTEHQSLSGYAKTEQLPTKVSDLTNDVGYITEDKNTTYTFLTTETGFIVTPSDGDPQTLDVGSNIDIDTELDEESENPVQNKAVATAIGIKADKTELPTKTSDLVNDSSFVPVIPITKYDYERLTEAELTSNILYWVVDEDAEDGYENGNEEAY